MAMTGRERSALAKAKREIYAEKNFATVFDQALKTSWPIS